MFQFKQVAGMVAIHALMLLGAATAWAGRGDIDPNYGEGGRLPISPSATLALPGDRLLITEAIDAGLRVRMVDAAGHDVPTFGEGGVVEIDSSEAAWPFWPDFAAHAPNGDMILAGSRLDTGAREILRLDKNGQPVLTFGDRGDGFVEPALATAQAMALAVDADGRIVLAEGSWNSDFSSCEGVARIQRLLANGQPDTGFGGDGLVEIPDLNICGGAVVFGARADGSVVVGDGQAIVAVNSAGDNDLAFGAGGRLYPPESVWTAGFLLPDESLLVYYSIRQPTGIEDAIIAKFDKNGLVDTAFGSGTGQVRLDDVLAYPEVGGIRGFIDRLMLAPDSAHLYARITMRRADASIFCVGIARYSIDGTFDDHFGRGGLTCLNFDLSLIAVQSTGAPLFLAGYDNAIHRLLPDDSPSPGLLKLHASYVHVGESDGTARVAIERLAGRDGAVSIDYTTSARRRYFAQGHCNGCGFWVESATAGSDYTATSGRLDWASGDDSQQSVNVKIDRDQHVENLETFGVDFSAPGGGAPLIGSSVTVMIHDGEQTTSTHSSSDASTGGGGGSVSWATPLALLALLLIRRRRVNRC